MQHQWDGNKYHILSNPQYISGLALIKHINLSNISSVIDLGCGSGRLTNELSKLLPKSKILGIDISYSMIKKAKQNLNLSANIEFICDNFLHLDFVNKVDLIFSNKVLHWIPNHKELFLKIYNTLNVSGQFVASFGVDDSMVKFREVCYQVGLDFNLLNLKLANYIDTINLLEMIGFKINYSEVIWDKCDMLDKSTYKDFVENILLQGANMNLMERNYWASKISKYINYYTFNFADMSIVAIK